MSINKKFKILIFAGLSFTTLSLLILFAFGTDINGFYLVVSDSMIPNLNTGDIIIINYANDDNNSSFNNLGIGEIIIFREPRTTAEGLQKRIVHRVTDIMVDSNGDRVIRTKGDANPYSIQLVDYPIREGNYIGKVAYIIPYVGLILMYLDLIIKVVSPPVSYVLMGAIATTVLVVQLGKRKDVLQDK